VIFFRLQLVLVIVRVDGHAGLFFFIFAKMVVVIVRKKIGGGAKLVFILRHIFLRYGIA